LYDFERSVLKEVMDIGTLRQSVLKTKADGDLGADREPPPPNAAAAATTSRRTELRNHFRRQLFGSFVYPRVPIAKIELRPIDARKSAGR